MNATIEQTIDVGHPVTLEWIGDSEVIASQWDNAKGCLWVITVGNGRKQLLRFFRLGDEVVASVDCTTSSEWAYFVLKMLEILARP